ncbi:DNA-binding protein H-NS [Candidatus Burkholderia verschuerenii]|uniref:DNA-binding protein H-NS n=1 Tax=Candidatus Burkholderia verschuerenii TaxID=242163 RepID=A0A0L0LVR8_9BURK|nr:H-NS histone family protein [Candidatus Burkholderia verschuerenii]KND54106.1 DNA-binding protein H-NS [Candidatus Burkholderia verschuerenii]
MAACSVKEGALQALRLRFKSIALTCIERSRLCQVLDFDKTIKEEKWPHWHSLETQIQKLRRRADSLRERKSAEVIANIRALMQQYGLTTADLDKRGVNGLKKRGCPVGSKNLPKDAKGAKGANGAGKLAAKSKMPPKYRDPVSGLTWSGHARPPAWIKDAPDRSVFLIDGAEAKANGKRVTTKTVKAAKKVTRKRVQSTAA